MSESSGDESEPPVTAGWLEAVLTPSLGPLQVTGIRISADVHPPEQPVLSDILAVAATIESLPDHEPRELHLIVKLLPQEPFQRCFVTEAQFDLREIKFYTEVAIDLEAYTKETDYPLELPIPKLYHAHYAGDEEPPPSPPPPSSVLILEDLTHIGYSVPEFSRGLTLAQAESALKAVAKLHAASLGLKMKLGTPLDKAYPFLFQTARATESYQLLVERGLPELAMFLQGRPGTEELMTALGKLKPATKDLISSLLAPREPLGLITHTDFWCNNLAFTKDEPPQCRILDWQMATYSRPSNDVALLIVSSVPTELRRSSLDELLNTYWAAFAGHCAGLGVHIPDYGPAEFRNDYAESQLLALLLCIGSVDVALGDIATEQRLLDLLNDLYNDGVFDLPQTLTESKSA